MDIEIFRYRNRDKREKKLNASIISLMPKAVFVFLFDAEGLYGCFIVFDCALGEEVSGCLLSCSSSKPCSMRLAVRSIFLSIPVLLKSVARCVQILLMFCMCVCVAFFTSMLVLL